MKDRNPETWADRATTWDAESWQSSMLAPTLRVVVHHVASVYPVEIDLAQTVAEGMPVVGVTGEVIDQMNASHAQQNRDVTRSPQLSPPRPHTSRAKAPARWGRVDCGDVRG